VSWTFAFRNLFRNHRRTVATAAAVIAGFIGLLLLGGYIHRVEISLRTNSIYLFNKGHITIFKKGGLERFGTQPSKYQVTPEMLAQIQTILESKKNKIDWIGKTLTGAGIVSDGDRSVPFFATGVDLQTLKNSFVNQDVLNWAIDFLLPGTTGFVQALEANPHSISVTGRLSDLLRKKRPYSKLSEDESYVQLAGMTQYGDLNAVDVKLAVNHSTGSEMLEDSGLLASVETLQELYSLEGFHYIMVYLKDIRDLDQILVELNQNFETNNFPLQAYRFDLPAISPNYAGSMGFLYVMSGFFVFLICGAVALSIMNSLTMGIIERTREIGTFRAIGFTQQQIAVMMTQEALCLCLISAALGTFLSFVISFVVNAANIRFSPPGVTNSIQFILSPNLYLVFVVLFIFLLVVGLTAYLVTTFKLKTKIINLLTDAGA